MKRICVVVGTRPEAIKLAPVIKSLRNSERAQALPVEVNVCVVAQHREMLDQVLSVFEIMPDFDLDVMTPGQELGQLTSKVLSGLAGILHSNPPDLVIVQGDTTTAFAGSVAAFYQKIPVAHVEAGLRTGDVHSPWPEEMNRRLISAIAMFHFAPTERAGKNLLREGVPESAIWITGNTVIDAVLQTVTRIRHDRQLREKLEEQLSFLHLDRKLILVTGHRRESFGVGFENICKALRFISEHRNVEIIYPVHLNPNVREPVNRILKGCSHVHLIEPLEYVSFVHLMMRSYLILTDSGGIQEEGPSLGKPVLVMRSTTERPEGIESGTVRLVGTERGQIITETLRLLDDHDQHLRMSQSHNPYGDGHAAERIAEILTGQT